MTDAEKVSVADAVRGLQKIVEALHPDLDLQRATWISFAVSFFRTCAPIARENKGVEYAAALQLVAEIGADLIKDFDFAPKGDR